MIADEIGMKYAARISEAFLEWAVQERLSDEVTISLLDPTPQISLAFYAAGEAQLEDISRMLNFGVKFNLRSPQAEAWIKNFGANEVRYLEKSNQEMIRRITLRGFQEGLTVQQQAKLIKEHIGLLPQHVDAVQNYRNRLIESGASTTQADKLAVRYRAKLLKYRANMIAITEGMTAANNGMRTATEDAVSRGILPPEKYQLEWRTSGLSNICDECKGMNNEHAPIGGIFRNGRSGPPVHQHCHCGTVVVRK